MNTQKLAAGIAKNLTRSEISEVIAELFSHLSTMVPAEDMLTEIFDACKEGEIAEALDTHFRKQPRAKKWVNPYADFLFEQLSDIETPTEIFERLENKQMSESDRKELTDRVQSFCNMHGDFFAVRVRELVKRQMLEEFVCREIYPHYNQQQAMIFVA